LTRNCPSGPTSAQGFDNAGLKVGEKAVNFTLRDVYGKEYRLSSLLVEKPVILIFGSFT
jgi:cytochrome oxidase Cu insertion factor (SCO1/SenC/PrrC family)